MGTELHGICNPFTYLQKSNCDVVALESETSDTRASFKNILLKAGLCCGLNHLDEDMERFLDRYNRDSIRNTMLKHEETFRHQVHELHRLYRVQKMMMAELRCTDVKLQTLTSATPRFITDTRSRQRSSASTSENSHSSHFSNTNQCAALLQSNTEAGPSLRELTTCSEMSRVLKGFDLEQPPEENAPTEARSGHDQIILFGKPLKEKQRIEDPCLRPEDETEIKLTLSIGR